MGWVDFWNKGIIESIKLKNLSNFEQGGPILKEAQTRPISRRIENDYKKSDTRTEIIVDKNRLERWKATGVVAIADCNLKVFLFNNPGCCDDSGSLL